MSQNIGSQSYLLKQWTSYLIAVGPIVLFFVGLIIYTVVDAEPKDSKTSQATDSKGQTILESKHHHDGDGPCSCCVPGSEHSEAEDDKSEQADSKKAESKDDKSKEAES